MNPFYADMPLDDLLTELNVIMRDTGVPPLDLVVSLMGYGLDVQHVMDSIQLELEAE